MADDGLIKIPTQTDPDTAASGYINIYNDGESIAQIDENGIKRSFFKAYRRAETASTTITLADVGNMITVDSASATTVTIPLDATLTFQDEDAIMIAQFGAGTLSIDPVTGVTVNGTDDTPVELLGGAYKAVATIVKLGPNEWWAYGGV